MPVYDKNDPKLVGYLPVDFFKNTDNDRSSRRIRDMPQGKEKEKGELGLKELTFSNIPANATSVPQLVFFRNAGYENITIAEIYGVGEFVVSHTCGETLEPGQFCQISVQFAPMTLGTKTGGVFIDNGEASGDKFIKLIGNPI